MNTVAPLTKYQKMILSQKVQAWDLDRDLNWSELDTEAALVPLSRRIETVLGLTDGESKTLSQLIGLMMIQTISQHESALASIKGDCWTAPVQKYQMPPDMRELGEEFFSQEQKHSQAFSRYVEEFAQQIDIEKQLLVDLLPSYASSSFCTWFMRMNAKLGGRAAWWLVMFTEEESLSIYTDLRPYQAKIDPLYFNLHRLHYEEEVRHMSYAALMLQFLGVAARGSWLKRLIQRCDLIFMYTTHILWLSSQFFRLRRMREIRSEHEFVRNLHRLDAKFKRFGRFGVFKMLYRELPWFRHLFLPLRHQSIRSEVNRTKVFGRSWVTV